MNQQQIIVIDENVLIQAQIIEQLSSTADYQIACFDSIASFIESLRQDSHIDLVLLEVTEHGQNALKHLYKIKKLAPMAKILVMTDSTTKFMLLQAIQAGSDGYYVKESGWNLLSTAIKSLLSNNGFIAPEVVKFLIEQHDIAPALSHYELINTAQYNLNRREIEMKQGLLSGLSYKEMSTKYYVSINTVRHYVLSLYRKTGVNSRKALIKKFNSYPLPS
jgi:two-component system nitrate/nitrite response regulator NarP